MALAGIAFVFSSPAFADRAQESALAERYSPVVRLVAHTNCAPGKPYLPINVDLLFGEPTVALRGPWGPGDLVKIGPSAKDLSKGLFEYHLDFPGSALQPGCDYLHWERRLVIGQSPTVYAHVATEPERPGKLALQYWLFYVFNDWNNLHEGDWEMIQLVFDASTPAEALERPPVEVGYSQHEGAERAAWGDDKLERVGGTHPVVQPAAGSHANFYGESLYLGSSAEQGVGCDDTRGPTFDIRPAVQTIPSDTAQARTDFPWIAFEGRWGELRPAFFNGPTGPNLKTQWTEPIRWSEGWRARSYTVPGGSAFGTGATDFFCGAVAHGSRGLVRLVDQPLEIRPRARRARVAPRRLAFPHDMAAERSAPPRTAQGVGPDPCRLRAHVRPTAAALRRHGCPAGADLAARDGPPGARPPRDQHPGRSDRWREQRAPRSLRPRDRYSPDAARPRSHPGRVRRALVEIDKGRPIGVLGAYRLAFDAVAPLFEALLVASIAVSLLASSIFLIPIAVWLAGRWALIAPAIELEDLSAAGALRRSGRLVRRRWLKVASLIVAGAVLVVIAGPLIGVVLILVTDAPFWLVNVIAGIVYAVAMPLVALVTAYVYFDARTRGELEAESELTELPAEIELST